MNRFIRYFNQNRIKIIIAILIIAFIIILIQAINYILKQSKTEVTIGNSVIIDSSIPSESVITGEKLPEETTQDNTNIIKEFVEYCNQKEFEKAYQLISQDCKTEMFNTLELFITNYCNNVFNSNMTYELELWYYSGNTYTYKITYYENNILATGNINMTNNKEDYITILEENGEDKININSFIQKETINKMQDADGIEIIINDRYRFRSYEKYNITVKNNTGKNLSLSDGNNSNDICLVDKNEVEYDCILNEISLTELKLSPGEQKTFNINFYKIYNLYRTIDKIMFKNVVISNENYNQIENESDRINISIDI